MPRKNKINAQLLAMAMKHKERRHCTLSELCQTAFYGVLLATSLCVFSTHILYAQLL